MIETVRLYIRWTVSFLLHFIRKKLLETDIRDREMRLRGKLLWSAAGATLEGVTQAEAEEKMLNAIARIVPDFKK